MKRLFAIAVLLLASSAAHAGDSYSFEVGGRTIHIEARSGCNSPSCVSVSIPGVYESDPKRIKRARANPQSDLQAKADPQARVEPPAPAAAKAQQFLEPANGAAPAAATAARSDPAPAALPRASEPTVQPQQVPAPANAPVAPAAAGPATAAAPVSAPIQQQQGPASSANRLAASPLGIWQTEEKEGIIRVEACGSNLCGYSVDAKTNQNGEQILINMKPASDAKWTGRIHDPNSGSNYDSTIALKGPDTLRVQGCAFGGMFCGGQTWSRVN